MFQGSPLSPLCKSGVLGLRLTAPESSPNEEPLLPAREEAVWRLEGQEVGRRGSLRDDFAVLTIPEMSEAQEGHGNMASSHFSSGLRNQQSWLPAVLSYPVRTTNRLKKPLPQALAGPAHQHYKDLVAAPPHMHCPSPLSYGKKTVTALQV